ncbi:MAG: hypothetical protein AAB864_01895, partial [Patescibacteria group bacterium]
SAMGVTLLLASVNTCVGNNDTALDKILIKKKAPRQSVGARCFDHQAEECSYIGQHLSRYVIY